MKPARDMTDEELKRAITDQIAKLRGAHNASGAKARLIFLLEIEAGRPRIRP